MSKDKGNRGEYMVRDLLEDWWGSDFAKTPKSGGFSTKKFREDWNAEADVVTPDETFPFAVEVKNQEDWILDDLLTRPKSKIWEWWEQAKGQSESKYTLLVFKRNYKPWFCMMKEEAEMNDYHIRFLEEAKLRVLDRQGQYAYIRKFDELLQEPVDKWRKKK